MTESYWLAEPSEPIPAARGDGPVDVAVVGAGRHGLLRVPSPSPRTGCACACTGTAGRLGSERPEWGLCAPRRGSAVTTSPGTSSGPRGRQSFWRLSERYLDLMQELAGGCATPTSAAAPHDDEELEKVTRRIRALREDGFSTPSGSTSWPLRSTASTAPRSATGRRGAPACALGPEARGSRRGGQAPRSSRSAGSNRSTSWRRARRDRPTDGYTSGLVPALDAIMRRSAAR